MSDRVKGLNLGADDYISKPFDLEEVLARVATVLRRYLKTECILEERFKNDPIAQYTLEQLNEKKAELKEKKEEYLRMRDWAKDKVMISPSASGTFDIEEYKEKIEDIKDEIEELKDEIDELKSELKEIREEIETEVEYEQWEREMDML